MKTVRSLRLVTDDPTLSPDERALLRCRAAADFERRGDYEGAINALGELWRGIGQRPALDGLGERAAAEVLLRTGAVSGWLGSSRQIEGAQDAAKDLLSESISRFVTLGERAKAAEAQSELGFCYRRAGNYDEARVLYNDALRLLPPGEDEQRAKTLVRLVVVEACSGHYHDALHLLTESAPIFGRISSELLKGKFHNELACAYTVFSRAETRPAYKEEYRDRAIIEYTAAAHHFGEAGDISHCALAESNLGFLLYLAGRYADALEHLGRARSLFLSVGNAGRTAQVADATALVLLALGRISEAASVIRSAVSVLEKGGEQALLSEALTTQGLIYTRLGRFKESRAILERAASIAETAGALEDAGRALLVLLEEHAVRLEEYEMLEAYLRAASLLKGTQDAEVTSRLREVAARSARARLEVVNRARRQSVADPWANFNLPEKVNEYEGRYMRKALIAADGSVTKAARLLGLPHHATLQAALENRHRALLPLRSPAEPRKTRKKKQKPKQKKRGSKRHRAASSRSSSPRAVASTFAVLHVEDHPAVADSVRDIFSAEGMTVASYLSGAEAATEVEGGRHYDIFIFDYDLPGLNGIELIRLVRRLPHRASTPIIMFSATDVEDDALAAGVTVFLRKPEDTRRLLEVVNSMRLVVPA
jgi:two-component system, chemotaxis family, chemotaxis protein CheY